METIKLTKEQSKVLEKMRDCHQLRNDKEALLVKHATGWKNAYETLNEIPMLGFAQLVLNDFAYEIEPEQPKFKAGDKVVREPGGEFLFNQLLVEVIGVSKNQWYEQQIEYEIEGCSYFLGIEYVRHATPEEIFWLETLGREKVGDFREGDVIFTIHDSLFKVVNSEFGSDDFVSVTNAKALKPVGIYPAESFRPFKKEPE